ncbi:WG repeat-containing protein [Peptoniphilaceae bacterium SGI.131]
MRKILNILMPLALFGLIFLVYIRETNKDDIFNKYRDLGDKYMAADLQMDAKSEYLKALNLKRDEKITEKLIKLSLKNKEYRDAIKYINLLENPKSLQDLFIRSLEDGNDIKSVNNLLLSIKDRDFRQRLESVIFPSYIHLNKKFSGIEYLPTDSSYIVGAAEKWRIINASGNLVSKDSYKQVVSSGKYITVLEDDGYKIYDKFYNLRGKIKAKNFGFDGIGMVVLDKEYFIADRLGQPVSKRYQYLSNFSDDLAVAKFNEKYSLIDREEKCIKDLNANFIKSNMRNDAIVDGKIIIKNDKYKMYDIKNNKFSQEYDDIDFSYGDYIAVKKGDKWTYIDRDFKEIIEGKYDLAKSFTCGIGIVKEGSYYIGIDRLGKELFKLENEIKQFSKEGVSFIRENEEWKMVRLVRFIK